MCREWSESRYATTSLLHQLEGALLCKCDGYSGSQLNCWCVVECWKLKLVCALMAAQSSKMVQVGVALPCRHRLSSPSHADQSTLRKYSPGRHLKDYLCLLEWPTPVHVMFHYDAIISKDVCGSIFGVILGQLVHSSDS